MKKTTEINSSENEALLIIYPFLPMNDGKPFSDVSKPVVGLAIGFASSDNVVAVEYRGDRKFEEQMIGPMDIDEGYYDENEMPTDQLPN
jgi:hypothetical protein